MIPRIWRRLFSTKASFWTVRRATSAPSRTEAAPPSGSPAAAATYQLARSSASASCAQRRYRYWRRTSPIQGRVRHASRCKFITAVAELDDGALRLDDKAARELSGIAADVLGPIPYLKDQTTSTARGIRGGVPDHLRPTSRASQDGRRRGAPTGISPAAPGRSPRTVEPDRRRHAGDPVSWSPQPGNFLRNIAIHGRPARRAAVLMATRPSPTSRSCRRSEMFGNT